MGEGRGYRIWVSELFVLFLLVGIMLLQFLMPPDLSLAEWVKRALLLSSTIIIVFLIGIRIAPTRELFHNTKQIRRLTSAVLELRDEVEQLRAEKFPSLVKIDEMMESEAQATNEVWVFSRALNLDEEEEAQNIIYHNLLSRKTYKYFIPDGTENLGAEKQLASLKKKWVARAKKEGKEIDLNNIETYHVNQHCFLSTVIIHNPNGPDPRFFIKLPSDLPEQSYPYVFKIRREDTMEKRIILDCLRDLMREECTELRKNKKKVG